MKYHADRLSTANADVHKIMALVHALREKAISTDYGTREATPILNCHPQGFGGGNTHPQGSPGGE